jgi:electron transfer flavoprotein alpha subunit
MSKTPKQKDKKQIRPKGIVVIAEHADGRIRPVTYEIISFAKQLQGSTPSNPIKLLLLADENQNPARELADKSGLDVAVVQIPEMTTYNGELYTHVLNEIFTERHPAFVCIAHTSQGMDYAPALAVKLNSACITGVGEVLDHDSEICFARPLCGGKIMARLKPASETTVLTIQPGIFKANAKTASTSGQVTVKSASVKNRQSRSLGMKPAEADTTGIAEANVIVAAGRGVGEKENLDLIYRLAALFPKSAVAGSRIVCDMGWLKYPCQVGVTGATVAPQLYIACGISGAVQHVMGMQSSEFIVAINKDPSAAIFQVADVCVIEDLTAFIPEFVRVYNET